MAKSKKDKKVVVNQAYFELIHRKAELLDVMCADAGSIAVHASSFKDYDRIVKDWDRAGASDFEGTETPYKEPEEG
jgi:hypothetical protein